MAERKNFWGEIPASKDLPDLPSKILKEQGSFLTEATSGALIGDVVPNNQKNQSFTAVLRIKVPTLNNYIFNILSISYPIHLYPVKVSSGVTGTAQVFTCNNVTEYENALSKILGSDKVKSVIQALLAQVNADEAISA